MATLPIHLEVEDVAVGPVLIALRKMPGIIKMNLDLLSGAPPAPPLRRASGGPNNAEQIIAMLVRANGGPIALAEIVKQLGCPKSSAYTSMHQLKQKHVIKNGGDKGTYSLTDKAKRELLGDTVRMLPAPRAKIAAKLNSHAIKRGPKGRASPGAGRAVVLDLLGIGPLSPSELHKRVAAKGISSKSLSGTLVRAKRDKLIVKIADNYQLTAHGKTEAATTTEGA